MGLAEALLPRRPQKMSIGQQQRVALARGLVSGAEILVLDEPTSALDVLGRRGTIDLLKSLSASNGTSFLLITHDLDAARILADHVLMMQDGRIVESGRCESVLREPQHQYPRALIGEMWTRRR